MVDFRWCYIRPVLPYGGGHLTGWNDVDILVSYEMGEIVARRYQQTMQQVLLSDNPYLKPQEINQAKKISPKSSPQDKKPLKYYVTQKNGIFVPLPSY